MRSHTIIITVFSLSRCLSLTLMLACLNVCLCTTHSTYLRPLIVQFILHYSKSTVSSVCCTRFVRLHDSETCTIVTTTTTILNFVTIVPVNLIFIFLHILLSYLSFEVICTFEIRFRRIIEYGVRRYFCFFGW